MQELPPIVEIALGESTGKNRAQYAEPLAVALFDEEIKGYSKNGRKLWSYKAPWPLSAFAVARRSGHSVAVSEDETGVAILNPLGKETARLKGRQTGFQDISISTDGERAAVLRYSGVVSAVTCHGKELWSIPVEEACSVEVSAEAGLVGVGAHNGVALIDEKGDLLWFRDLPNFSVVLSAISSDGNKIVLVGSPGCRIVVLNRSGDICYDEYRTYIPKALCLAEAGCFAVGYGVENAGLGIPSSEPLHVELFTPSSQDTFDFESVISVLARCFGLADDGTLTVFTPDGIIEAWPAEKRGGHLKGSPIWSFEFDGDALAVAGFARNGPVLTVLWDEYAGQMVFDHRAVKDHMLRPPVVRFCIQCGREYRGSEAVCAKCIVPLHDAAWCEECGSHYCLPLGERCPVHGTKLRSHPSV